MPQVPAPRRGVLAAVAVAVLIGAVGTGLALRSPAASTTVETTSTVPTPTSTPLAPEEQPGPGTVTFSEAAAEHPDRDAVRALLQGHFDAINLGDYRRWATTVIAERAEQTSEESWREQYRSTRDGSIVVQRLEPRFGGGLIILITFTSVQDPADAPEEMPVDCLEWRVTYSVVSESDQLRLGPSAPGSSLREPCY